MNLFLLIALTSGMVPLERTVAVVEDTPVLHSEVMEMLAAAGIEPAGSFDSLSATAVYREALEELVEERLLVLAGIDAGYYPTEEETRAIVAAELSANPALAGIDPEHLSLQLAENQAAQAFLGRKVQAALSDMPFSAGSFLEARTEMVEELVMPRRLAWIYLSLVPSGPDYHEAVSEMLQLRARIMAGEPFEELAEAYSDDNSATRGGYLGFFGPGEMTYSFEKAAFSLEPGEVSQPVATPFGLHIIRLDSREEDGRISASHILRAVEVDSTDVQTAMERAHSIIGEIRSGELSYGEAASLYSMDMTTARQGGDLGTVPLKLWIPAVLERVSELEPGSCSEPIYLADAGAVVIIRLQEDPGTLDWSYYTADELAGLVQQVIYLDTYGSVVDSLRREIPVVYLVEDDGAVED